MRVCVCVRACACVCVCSFGVGDMAQLGVGWYAGGMGSASVEVSRQLHDEDLGIGFRNLDLA